jgi:hypothetical protein
MIIVTYKAILITKTKILVITLSISTVYCFTKQFYVIISVTAAIASFLT